MESFSWKTTPKYSNTASKDKKLPHFYDFYDVILDFLCIYAPGGDSFLLIDSIVNDLPSLNKTTFDSSIEIGCGSGIVSASYLECIKDKGITLNSHTCVDINNYAVKITQGLMEKYKFHPNVSVIESSLFNAIDNDKVFDIIFFNPPYVTTDDEEYAKAIKIKDLGAAWAGGKFGSETIYEFIKQLKTHISKETVVYLLLSAENECGKIVKLMKELYGFNYEMLMKKREKNEMVGVFRFTQ